MTDSAEQVERPTERTVVHLVRHGQVDNPSGILYGRLPGYHFADRDIVAVVASPLERAQETAAPIAARHDLEVSADERLIEADNLFAGKKFGVGDGVLKRPSVWPRLVNPFRPSWGEPYVEVVRRMGEAVAAARELGVGHEVVCVSHQLPIWEARLAAENRRLWHDPRRRECTLASVTSFTFLGTATVSVDYAEPARDLLPEKKSGKFVAGA
jgi:broad specificity phosphatase PhoE